MSDLISLLPATIFTILLIGLIAWPILIYISLIVGMAQWAKRWNRKPEDWVILSIFMTVLFASILLLMLGKKENKPMHEQT